MCGGLHRAFSDAQTVIWLRMQYWKCHKLRGGAISVTGHGVAFFVGSDFLSVGSFFVRWDFLWWSGFFFCRLGFFFWLGFFLSVEIFSAGCCRLDFFLSIATFFLVGIFLSVGIFFCPLELFSSVGNFFVCLNFFRQLELSCRLGFFSWVPR